MAIAWWGIGFLNAADVTTSQLQLTGQERKFIAEHPPVTVAITPEWAPFSYFTDKGEPAGIDVDVLRLISQSTGFRYKFIEGNPPWEEIWQMAQRGELDLTTSVVQTTEREKVFKFTQPYSKAMTVIIARAGDLRFPNLSQLRYATVALPRDHIVPTALTNLAPEISTRLFESQEDCFQAVARGKADVTAVNLFTATQYLNDHPRDRLAICGAISEFEFPLRLAARRDYPLLVDILNKGLAAISQKELDEITKRHLTFALSGSRRAALLKQRLVYVVSGALLLIAVIMTWNWRIKKEVVARRAAEADLREMNQSLEIFSHSIAHDLRNPLRAISGLSEALEQDYGAKLDENGRNYLDRIMGASMRMEALVRDVLAYSQASQATLPMNAVSVQQIVNELIRELPPEQKAAIRITSPLPEVRAHPALLSQCIGNLISNALKFVDENRKPEIKIGSENKPAMVVLWIQDNGIGIRPEDQQRIFDLFERGTDQRSGTGIGLAVVAKGVERMGGKVGVESKLNEGSRFWIELMKADS
jgi:signal transduction histidine kinase